MHGCHCATVAVASRQVGVPPQAHWQAHCPTHTRRAPGTSLRLELGQQLLLLLELLLANLAAGLAGGGRHCYAAAAEGGGCCWRQQMAAQSRCVDCVVDESQGNAQHVAHKRKMRGQPAESRLANDPSREPGLGPGRPPLDLGGEVSHRGKLLIEEDDTTTCNTGNTCASNCCRTAARPLPLKKQREAAACDQLT